MQWNTIKGNTPEQLLSYYIAELKDNILPFWEKNCLDPVNGGYFNCFTNDGKKLMSRDKYTWSQGRFVWIWSKLALIQSSSFTEEDRQRYLSYAKLGIDFLRKHALIEEGDWRCAFLNDEFGNHKYPEGQTVLNGSIYADCFVILAFSKYSLAAGDPSSYAFARSLYDSAMEQLEADTFYTLPYPLSRKYRAHGIPMIFDDVTKELLRAAEKYEPGHVPALKARMDGFVTDILSHFVDPENRLREIISSADNSFLPGLLGRHINPGHTLEDMWFVTDAADILGRPEWVQKADAIARKALSLGWDEEFGGILHFSGLNGGKPEGETAGDESETMLRQAVDGWGDKLWWVHSEALYTTLLLYTRTGDPEYLAWHDRILAYVEEHHVNPDRETGEWIQILTREGKPQQKVTALPVKDPYHIIRNLALIIELLEQQK